MMHINLLFLISLKKILLNLIEKLTYYFSALEGDILRIFPTPNDVNNKWVSYSELKNENFVGIDSLFVNNIFPLYLKELDNGISSGDYKYCFRYSRKYKRLSV